jgi:hypothetical protein
MNFEGLLRQNDSINSDTTAWISFAIFYPITITREYYDLMPIGLYSLGFTYKAQLTVHARPWPSSWAGNDNRKVQWNQHPSQVDNRYLSVINGRAIVH